MFRDLRDNGGGVDDAVSCIDLIAPEGTVAYADKNETAPIDGGSDIEQGGLPIVCLVNSNTASAAGLVACAPPDGARLVGTTTMGEVIRAAAAPFGWQHREHHGGKSSSAGGVCFGGGTGLSDEQTALGSKRPRISDYTPGMARRSSVRSAQKHSS